MKHWNEARANNDVELQIDQSLRRQFDAPQMQFEIPIATPGGLDRARLNRLGRGRTWGRVAVAALVLVAGMAVFARVLPDPPVAEPATAGDRVASRAPLSVTEHSDPDRPDIADMYEEILSFPKPAAACNQSSAQISSGVERRFESRCGATMEFEAETASMLEGPFFSDEWPSGTVLAGYPDGPDQPPVVIVAECTDYQDCCIDLLGTSRVGLQHFTTEVGGVTLTEITPYQEPRMLAALTRR